VSDFGAVERSFPALRTRKKPRESAENPRVRACTAPPFTTVALAAGAAGSRLVKEHRPALHRAAPTRS
jgi:hypothetical protein